MIRCFVLLALAATLSAHVPSLASADTLQPGEPFAYRPFYPQRWKEKETSTQLIPWAGKQVVLLTTSADFDGEVMAIFLQRLDAGWKVYADLSAKQPRPHLSYDQKPTIAAVPDASYTCGVGCGYLGQTGIEVGNFYSGHGDYAAVAARRDAFPHYYFYEMGRNYFVYHDQIGDSATGFAVFMRYVCMDATGAADFEADLRKVIEQAESEAADSPLTFAQLFTNSAGIDEKTPRLKSSHVSDQPVMFASVMLKLRRDYGGDQWVKQFFHYLAMCPSAGRSGSPDSAQAQGLNWLLAASCAAQQDLSGLFVERWRMTLGEKTRAALRQVDWKNADLTPQQILDALPTDELPKAFAPRRSAP